MAVTIVESLFEDPKCLSRPPPRETIISSSCVMVGLLEGLLSTVSSAVAIARGLAPWEPCCPPLEQALEFSDTQGARCRLSTPCPSASSSNNL